MCSWRHIFIIFPVSRNSEIYISTCCYCFSYRIHWIILINTKFTRCTIVSPCPNCSVCLNRIWNIIAGCYRYYICKILSIIAVKLNKFRSYNTISSFLVCSTDNSFITTLMITCSCYDIILEVISPNDIINFCITPNVYFTVFCKCQRVTFTCGYWFNLNIAWNVYFYRI